MRADPSTVRTPRQRGQTHPTVVKRWIRTVTDEVNEWRHAGGYCWYANALLGSRVESPTPRLARPDTAAVDRGYPPYTVCGELCGFLGTTAPGLRVVIQPSLKVSYPGAILWKGGGQ